MNRGTGVRPHAPLRPMWLCRACARPWPCAVSRLLLLDEYAGNRSDLCVRMSARFHESVTDLYRLNPYEAPDLSTMYQRFLAWVPPKNAQGRNP